MQGVQTGDDAALGELLDRYRLRLFAFAVRRSGDAASAEDLFQETWLRVVRARASFDPSRRFSTWLFQIANNLCRDLARRRAVEAKGRERLRADADLEPPGDARPGLRIDVERSLAGLPDRLREVLVLRYYHQLSEREIARVAGVPPGTVKSRLHAAVRALRTEYERDVTPEGDAAGAAAPGERSRTPERKDQEPRNDGPARAKTGDPV